jgi:cell division protein FtsA
MAKELPNGRAVVHHIRRPFRLDGRLLADPEHLVGQRLEVGYWTVHGSEAKISDHIHIITGFNLRVHELILSSLAAGAIVTSPEERQNGVLVLDIGCGTTDYVLYHDGVAYQTGVVPVGGDHFTNDLSLGLRLPRRQAEKIKLQFGRCTVKTSEETRPVWLNSDLSMGAHPFPIHSVERIISARVREIFEVVKARLGAAFFPNRTAAGIVITGGTSKLTGIAPMAADVFGVPARLGEPPPSVSEPLRDPSYSTVLGLFHSKDLEACGVADPAKLTHAAVKL